MFTHGVKLEIDLVCFSCKGLLRIRTHCTTNGHLDGEL